MKKSLALRPPPNRRTPPQRRHKTRPIIPIIRLKSIYFFFFLTIPSLIFFGCAQNTPQDSLQDTISPPPAVPLPVSPQLQALQDEQEEQYLEALLYWKQAENVVTKKISTLSERLKELAETHAKRGIAYFEEKQGDKALHEFIEALRYDPGNRVALDYMQNRYGAGRYILYSVKEADDFAKIAETVYGDQSYAFVVSLFSNVEREEDLVAGEMINLAVLNSFYSQALLDYSKRIHNARQLFSSGAHEAAVSAAEAILKDHPEDSEASYILNMSLLRIAEFQRQQEQYDDAVRTLAGIDPAFKNVKGLIQEIREEQQSKAAKDAQLANSELFRRGEEFYAQGRYLEALQSLLQVDSSYPGLDSALTRVETKLEVQADRHYKEGVKYFVEENLAAAIAEWEKTLELNPNHLNAINSIEKARDLLEKVKKIN